MPSRIDLADPEVFEPDAYAAASRPRSTGRILRAPGARAASARATGTHSTSNQSGSLRRRLATGQDDRDDSYEDDDEPTPPRRAPARRPSRIDPPDEPRIIRSQLNPPRDLLHEIAGLGCIALGLLLFINGVRPIADGVLPRLAVGALRWMFGIGALIIPLAVMVFGSGLIGRRRDLNIAAYWRGAAAWFLILLAAVHLQVPAHHEFGDRDRLFEYGGYVGAALVYVLRHAVGEAGAVIVLVASALVALVLCTQMALSEMGSRGGRMVARGARRVGNGVSGRRWRENRARGAYESSLRPDRPKRPLRALPPEITDDPRRRAGRHGGRLAERDEHDSPFLPLEAMLHGDLPPVEPLDAWRGGVGDSARGGAARRGAAPAPAVIAPRIEIIDTPPPPSVVGEALDVGAALAGDSPANELTPGELLEAQAQATATAGKAPKKVRPQLARRSFGDGPLMPEYFDSAVRALDPPVAADVAGVEDDIQKGVASVQDTLAAFKIDARVTDVKRGPVITRYEVQPAPGVRVAAIANLDRDIARALSAIAVRIEAPVPGKNVVGIEVPNKRVHLVRLRDVLELPEFLAAPSKLAFVLGKDIAGQPKWADLTKMPHLLIAGATNSGKSVCLNSIIASIIARATPEEVKFSLIDPKRVELTLYKDIKHLYHPVVVEPKDAVRALRGAIAEMDRRYKRFAERGVRNIASYNSKLLPDEVPLPYLVIVIDELADLMMTAAAEFEKLICRLAQLARATGIHLIVATQRPSVNVITGVIKANIPARIAFAVASQVDSRTILDSVGAERLIGSGDMLFDANNGGKSVRIQGAYLSEEEVNRVVEVVKDHYANDDEPIQYGLNLNEIDEDLPGGGDDYQEEKRDELYAEIREFVLRNNEMSASMIQRKFEIGYPRAGRIVDQLERDGILSPADGSKARKVIGTGR